MENSAVRAAMIAETLLRARLSPVSDWPVFDDLSDKSYLFLFPSPQQSSLVPLSPQGAPLNQFLSQALRLSSHLSMQARALASQKHFARKLSSASTPQSLSLVEPARDPDRPACRERLEDHTSPST